MAIFRKTQRQPSPAASEDDAPHRAAPTPPELSQAPAVVPAPRAAQGGGGGEGSCVIGASLEIRGDVIARADIIVLGQVHGKIVADGHRLTIGPSGIVRAELHAEKVKVRGQVFGDITADSKVEIAPTGKVLGDITAPRVRLCDGSSFTGSINRNTAAAVIETGGGELRGPSEASTQPRTQPPKPERKPTMAAPAGREGLNRWTLVDRRGKGRPWSSDGKKPRATPPSPTI